MTLIVTDMAVIEPTPDGLELRETAPAVTAEAVTAATGAPLILGEMAEMRVRACPDPPLASGRNRGKRRCQVEDGAPAALPAMA